LQLLLVLCVSGYGALSSIAGRREVLEGPNSPCRKARFPGSKVSFIGVSFLVVVWNLAAVSVLVFISFSCLCFNHCRYEHAWGP
jgi:hypothetical protein